MELSYMACSWVRISRLMTSLQTVKILNHAGCRALIERMFAHPHVLHLQRKDNLCHYFTTFTVKHAVGKVFDNGAHLIIFFQVR